MAAPTLLDQGIPALVTPARISANPMVSCVSISELIGPAVVENISRKIQLKEFQPKNVSRKNFSRRLQTTGLPKKDPMEIPAVGLMMKSVASEMVEFVLI